MIYGVLATILLNGSMDDFVTMRLMRGLTGPGVFSQCKVIIFIIRLFSEKA